MLRWIVILFVGLAACASPAIGNDVVMTRDGQIYLVRLTGGERKLLELPDGAYAKDPAWSADGKFVAYSYYPVPSPTNPAGSDIYLVNADGGQSRILRRHQVIGELLEAPTFSPDGSALLYSRFSQTFKNGVFVEESLDIVRHDLTSGDALPIIKSGTMPSFSPDGKQLVYVRIDPTDYAQSLWVASADGSNPKPLFDDTEFAQITYPRFSPDGRTIAFSGSPIPKLGKVGLAQPLAIGVRHGLPSDLFMVATSGGTPAMLVKLAEDNPAPLWSADGKRLVVIGAYALYRYDLESQHLERLRETGGIGGDWRGR